uniref:SFRICE_005271 n=1 Tax=Spodoptera frugiperda TaxID=7108 RepID=A0A2H1VMW9_SPOFR
MASYFMPLMLKHSRRSDAFVQWLRRRAHRAAAAPPNRRLPCSSKLPPTCSRSPRALSTSSPSSPRNTPSARAA